MWRPMREQRRSGQHDLTALVQKDPSANGGCSNQHKRGNNRKDVLPPSRLGRGSLLIMFRATSAADCSGFRELSARADHGEVYLDEGRASTVLMSRTARQAPSGVPVTLERPRRGR